MRSKRFLILGDALTGDAADHIETRIGQIEYRHGIVLTADDHGVCAEVIRQAADRRVPCQIVGVCNRPAYGSRTNYLRLIVDARLPRDERNRLRDQFLVQMADYVITIGEHPAFDYALRRGKKFVYKAAARHRCPKDTPGLPRVMPLAPAEDEQPTRLRQGLDIPALETPIHLPSSTATGVPSGEAIPVS